MEIIVNRNGLSKALDIVYPITKQNKALAILSNIKTTIDKGVLNIYAYDGSNSIELSCKHDTDIDEKVAFLVNCGNVKKVIQALTDATIKLIVGSKVLTISYECGHIEIPISDATEYPTEQQSDNNATKITIPCDFIRRAFVDADVFAAVDDFHPIMQGVYLYAKGGELGYCITDTIKLVHNKMLLQGVPEFEVVIPNNKTIINAISKSEVCDMAIYENRVEFSTAETKISLSLIQGIFPNFRRVIPTSHTISALASVSTLVQCFNRLSSYTDDKQPKAKFDFSIYGTDVESVSFDNMILGKEHLQDIQSTDNITIGLNILQMQNVFKTMPKTGNVMLEFNDGSRPVIIKHEDMPNRLVLIMPMSLNG